MTPLVLAILALLGPRPAPGPTAWLVIVSGLSGEERYAGQFHDWGAALRRAAIERFGIPPAQVRWLAEDPARDPEGISGRSTAEGVRTLFADLAGRLGEADNLLVVLIGHGSEQGGRPRLNLPGPDLEATEWAALLSGVPAARSALVNTSSSSGGFLEPLTAPGRVVITATRSGLEREETRFPAFFVEAFSGEDADADKDGRLSLLEAFEYARERTGRWYERERQILTEHALLADAEGQARRFYLDVARVAAEAAADPELAALRREREGLREAIERLKAHQAGMAEEVYLKELEGLLLRLAEVNRKIREHKGGLR